MPSEADHDIATRDSALPGLALLLDTDRLADALRGLPGLGSVSSVATTYLRYKPGTSCVAGLRLEVGEGPAEDLFAKLLPLERHAAAWARPRWQAEVASGSDDAPRSIAQAGLLLLRPAHDRGLKVMRRLERPAEREALLGALLEPASGPVPNLLRPPLQVPLQVPLRVPLQLQTLRYKPERRLVARVTRAGQPVAVLRACSADNFSAALIGATLGAAQGGARVMGALVTHGLLASAWLPGRPLCPESAGLPGERTMAQMGDALARLHGGALQHPLQRGRADEVAAVQRAVDGLGWLRPSLAARASRLAGRAAGALATAAWRPTFIHGDFSIDQVVAEGDALHLIDWDSAARGDPAADLGSLWARLELQVIEDVVARDAADAAIEAFVEGHARAAGPARLTADAVAAQAAAHLLRLSGEPFRKRSAEWPAQAEALLARAEALLPSWRGSGLQGTVRGEVGGGESNEEGGAERNSVQSLPLASVDTAMPQLAEAVQPGLMRPALAQALGLPAERLQVLGASVLRHKPGRRALIAYTLAMPSGECAEVLGKLRAKGLDTHGYEVQQAFWRSGFREPGVAVPEPLGLLPLFGLWLQRKLPGTSAAGHFEPGGETLLAARIATALAALHRCGPQTLRQWTLDDELHMLRSRLRQAAALRPAMAQRIEALAMACDRLGASLPRAEPTGIHRDFYPDQVLVDGDALALLDFDLYAQGDPALDVGNFVAHLSEQALRRHGDAMALRRHEDALVERYLSLSPRVEAGAVRAWATLSLARHVYLSTQFAERLHTTEPLLALCEQRLAPWRLQKLAHA